MIDWCRCLLILLTLVLSGAPSPGAPAGESRFKDAVNNFRLGFWGQAAQNFADFARRYPASPRVPEAILYQAEALINQAETAGPNRLFTGAIELLSTNQFRAGPWADQYLFWIGQAHLRNTDYAAAAYAFERLLSNFPVSTNRFDAVLGAATARAKLEQWPRVVGLLQDANGVFQQAARAGPANEGITSGYLLLGEAQLAQTNYSEVNTALQWLDRQKLGPAPDWRRHYLRCRLLLAEDHPQEALQNTTNLVALSGEVNDPRLSAETTVLEATILERLGSLEEAVAAWQRNLATTMPAEQQSRALLKIAELCLSLNQPAEAVRMLERYRDQRPAPGAVDLATLTIGELELRQYLTESATNQSGLAATNLLSQASARFDLVLDVYTNSPWTGKALLDKGWCLWISGRIAQSEEAFRQATGQLPFSEDQAVARFKWADAQFTLTNFDGAVANYHFLVTNCAALPGVQERLLELALYQTVRAALAATNLAVATDALRKILEWYPNGFAGDRCLLLVGEGLTRQSDTAAARELFADFERRWPESPLLPELRLAIARTYEQEGNWTAAMNHYDGWIESFTNSARLPLAEFCLARATAMAGQETKALTLYTNFVARFPSDELAPRAQWCVGDYYDNRGDYYNAERKFQYLFQTWTNSELACEAQMRAGRAAMAPPRLIYKDAIGYFTNLYNNPACGVELKIEAALWAGDAFMSRTDSAERTNRLANLEEALGWFEAATRSYPANPQAPLAYIKIGNCNLQWAVLDPQKYAAASNAYQQVLTLTNATGAARNWARIGLATVAEKQAGQKSGEEQTVLLNLALSYCLEVLNRSDDTEGEKPDPHALKEAGLQAGSLAEKLGLWPQAVNVYTNLAGQLPTLRPFFERKALKVQEHIKQGGM